MTTYRVSRDAQADVVAIGALVAERNPSAAKRVLRAVRRAFEFLAEHPHAGMPCDDWLPGGRMFTCKKPASNYVVIFIPKSSCIDIVAVLHGARDLPAELGARETS